MYTYLAVNSTEEAETLDRVARDYHLQWNETEPSATGSNCRAPEPCWLVTWTAVRSGGGVAKKREGGREEGEEGGREGEREGEEGGREGGGKEEGRREKVGGREGERREGGRRREGAPFTQVYIHVHVIRHTCTHTPLA